MNTTLLFKSPAQLGKEIKQKVKDKSMSLTKYCDHYNVNVKKRCDKKIDKHFMSRLTRGMCRCIDSPKILEICADLGISPKVKLKTSQEILSAIEQIPPSKIANVKSIIKELAAIAKGDTQ